MSVVDTSAPPVPRDGAVAGDATERSTGGTPPPGTPNRVGRVVVVLFCAALAALAVVSVVVPRPWPGWDRFAVITAVVALSLVDGSFVHRGRGRVRITLSLSEIGVLVAVVHLPGVAAALAIAAGSLAYELLIRREHVKALFNVTQNTMGGCTGVLLLAVLPSLGASLGNVSLVTASIAVLGYVLTTAGLWLVLLRQLLGPGAWRELLPMVGVDAVTALGATSLGVVALSLWTHERLLLGYLILPLAAILVAYRLVRLSQELSRQRSTDAESLQRLVSSVSDGIVMIDEDDAVLVWNPVLESLTGVAAPEAEGRPLDEVLAGLTRVADAPLGATSRTVAAWRDGRVMEERTSVVADGDAAAGRVIVLRDITRQHEADALKSDFVARVSHELRTPLTPLTGFIELLRTQIDRFDPRTHTAALDAMARNTARMSALVDQLLTVVEIDKGSLPAERGPVDVAAAVGIARDRLRADASGHEIVVDVPTGTVAMGDLAHLTHVLEHLLDNAVRYSVGGTRVEITATEEDGAVRLQVRDHGPGIPPTAQDLVFERFSRLEDPLRMRTSGLGLGLFVARRLTEAMGGVLELVSSDHRGTTMALRLPALA